MKFPPIEEQLAVIRRGTEEILPAEALVGKLRTAEETGTPLVVKLGCDPSRPDLHLGHSVVLRKLRQFQDLGHRAVLIVGDFTGMIGDPTGRSKTRPPLTLEETRKNGRSYFEQASAILDPEKTDIRYNSEWLGEMAFDEVIELAAKYTVARMLERDDFEERYAAGKAIGVHEFLYPLAQAQDSAHIRADVELGGTDQKFNLLVGRHIQEAAGQEPQVCVTLPLLEGTDGTEKMSKSLDNYIGIAEPPEQMYGKVMSIPDALIYRYVELCTDVPTEDLPKAKSFAERAPHKAKHELASTIVRMYHDAEAVEEAYAHFQKTVARGEVPDDVPRFQPEPDEGTEIGFLNLLNQAGLVESNSQARRLIKQNAVSIDGEKVQDTRLYLDLAARAPFTVQVGKRRFARITWNGETER